jgi:thioredoxin-dependent peroxiredoxin
MVLQIGDRAPDFTLPDTHGNSVTLSKFMGKRVVLYFYPRDNTPGCIKEACAFRDRYADFQNQDIIVLGVSTDDAKSHEKFVTKHDLPFPLLCDEGGKIAELYDSYGLKKFMGKEYLGITRNTFVIGAAGNIEKIYKKVKPELHAAGLLTDLS